jgi:hypothetical protein
MDEQGPVPAVVFEVLDVGTEGLGDPQAGQRQQRRQRMIAAAGQAPE